MRDCQEFLRGLLTFRDNPYFLRWVRKDARSHRVLRNHTIGLCLVSALAYISLLLGGWVGDLLETSMLPLGDIPRTELMALSVIAVHSWMAMFAVSFRAGQCIEHEYRIRSLDMVRVTGLDRMRLMGMKATYPLVFGLAMFLPALPLYVLLVLLGGISARELLGLFIVVAIISIRPSGASVIGGSVNVAALDEWKRRVIMAVVGAIVAVQFFFFGLTMYRIPTFLGSASQTILLPAAWARIAAEGILTVRPFFETRMPFVIAGLVLLPLMWPAVAMTAFERVVEGVPRLRLRANPSWHWAMIVLGVVIIGFTWEALLGPRGLARISGSIVGDAASALAGLWPVLLAAWTLPTAWMLALTGRSTMGLLPCGDRAPRNPRLEARLQSGSPDLGLVAKDIAGAVSVLAWPIIAFALCCAAAGRAPALTSSDSLHALSASAGALIYCYGLGRWVALDAREARAARRAALGLAGLALFVGTLAFLGTTNLGPLWTVLHPVTGLLGSLSGLCDEFTALESTQTWLPGASVCGLVHAALGALLLAAHATCVQRLEQRAAKPAFAAPPAVVRSTDDLLAEDAAHHRWVRDPLVLRLLRSNRTTVLRRVMRIVPPALGASSVLFALIMPEQVGRALQSIDIIPAGSDGSNPYLGAFAVAVGLCTAVLSVGAFATGSEALRLERDQGTAGQLLLTQLSSRAIGLGYQKPVWRTIAESALLLLPFAGIALAQGASRGSLWVVASLYALLLIDPFCCAACGGVGGMCIDRPWLTGAAKTAFMGQRAVVLMAFFVFMGDRLMRGSRGRLMLSHPYFIALLAIELIAGLVCLSIAIATVRRLRRDSIDTVFGGGA